MAAVEDGELAWAKAYGVADTATGTAVTGETVFRACSLSKVVSAYGAIRFLREHGVSLDAALDDVLPHPTVTHQDASRITTRMVLSHTSGLSHTIRNPKLESTPGSRWSYSSGGFAYLQMVIEHLSGRSFARFARESILDPIGMSSSDYAWREEWENLCASSHDEDGNKLTDGRIPEGQATSGGSLYSTPRDICRFVTAILQDEETLEVMMEPVVSMKGALAWGNGWGLENDPATGAWGWQWGWSRTGFRNYMAVHPDSGRGIVIFTNGMRGYTLWKPIATEVVGGRHSAIDWVLRDL